jgi:hypothetical protein
MMLLRLNTFGPLLGVFHLFPSPLQLVDFLLEKLDFPLTLNKVSVSVDSHLSMGHIHTMSGFSILIYPDPASCIQ